MLWFEDIMELTVGFAPRHFSFSFSIWEFIWDITAVTAVHSVCVRWVLCPNRFFFKFITLLNGFSTVRLGGGTYYIIFIFIFTSEFFLSTCISFFFFSLTSLRLLFRFILITLEFIIFLAEMFYIFILLTIVHFSDFNNYFRWY